MLLSLTIICAVLMLMFTSVIPVVAEIPAKIYVNKSSENQIDVTICDNGTQLVNGTCVFPEQRLPRTPNPDITPDPIIPRPPQ